VVHVYNTLIGEYIYKPILIYGKNQNLRNPNLISQTLFKTVHHTINYAHFAGVGAFQISS